MQGDELLEFLGIRFRDRSFVLRLATMRYYTLYDLYVYCCDSPSSWYVKGYIRIESKALMAKLGLHIRRQLPGEPSRLWSPPVFLRHRPTGLHQTNGEIPCTQHRQNRLIKR